MHPLILLLISVAIVITVLVIGVIVDITHEPIESDGMKELAPEKDKNGVKESLASEEHYSWKKQRVLPKLFQRFIFLFIFTFSMSLLVGQLFFDNELYLIRNISKLEVFFTQETKEFIFLDKNKQDSNNKTDTIQEDTNNSSSHRVIHKEYECIPLLR